MHPKARHHCYAWKLGLDENNYRANDDGEPSGSAGRPIYGQIRSKNLSNVLVVVVRYFGGTKLGTSGLINAYKEATKEAIKNTEILLKYKLVAYKITFDYSKMGQLLESLKKLDIKISDKVLNVNPYIIISTKESELTSTIKKIKAHLLQRSIGDIDDDTVIKGIDFRK